MADPKAAERTVLKLLAGAQAGVEVSLDPGEYLIGTAAEDDIQFIDVSMKPSHARVRLAPGKIEIRKEAGSFFTAAGLRPQADDWQEIQPLDVVTAGTTRFAFGPPTAQWATIADQGELVESELATQKPASRSAPAAFASKLKSFAIPIGLLTFFLAVGIFFLALNRGAVLTGHVPIRDQAAVLRAALDRFDFGRAIAVRQDVDGAIYVSGYVESPVQRRAIVGAIEDLGIAVRLRVGVLQVLRNEVAGLIKAEKVKVTFDLSSAGDLTLKGLILDEAAADRFVAEMRESVIGLNKIRSDIRTAKAVFAEVRDLAHLSQIDDAVVFRLNGSTIEANGVISANKIDQWVGFLQAYSRRFGDEIGLRSYVQLQNENMSAQAKADAMAPILVGAVPPGKGINLDLSRLRSGNFKFADAFAGPTPTLSQERFSAGKPAGAAKTSDPPLPLMLRAGPIASLTLPPRSVRPTSSQAEPSRALIAFAGDPPGKNAKDNGRTPLPATFRHDVGDMTVKADSLMKKWLDGGLGKAGSKSAALDKALNTLATASLGLTTRSASLSEASKEMFAHKYLPLFALSRESNLSAARQCRPGSRLSLDNLPAALFWLDLMSTTNAITLQDFDVDAQGFVLEAALNPELAAQCLRRDPATASLVATSIYLGEARRNPDFVRFVTQGLPAFALDVSGASLSGRRFVQLRDGSKLHEGEAPDAASRVDTIGELGVSILLGEGFAAVVYPVNITWLAEK